MTRQKAKALLEKQKKKLRENFKKNVEMEKGLDTTRTGSDILGPRDQMEYRRVLKEIKESDNDE